MRRHHLAKAATLALALTAAAILVPTPAAAHARPTGYSVGHEYWSARTPTARLLPPLNRGTVAVVLADRDLERFGSRT